MDAASSPRITFRAVALGMMGGAAVCVAAPYNDWAMHNTPLVGNSLPLAAISLLFLFALLVNGPLSRWRPARAWTGVELGIALTLMTVMCSMPTSGLMRFLVPNLAAPFRIGLESATYREVIERLQLPPWLFPSYAGDAPRDWIGDPLAVRFGFGWLDVDGSPYVGWVVPFFSWGIFVGALCASLTGIVCIVLRQWRENEHLPFPLVNVHLALIEPPAPGRWLNRVMSSRAFWIAFAAVFALHVNNGLATYFPQNVPVISRGFDLRTVFNEPPLSYTDTWFRSAGVVFSIIGVTYFLSSSIAFSLWAFVVLFQVYRMILGGSTGDPTIVGMIEQRLGVALAFFLSIVWLGRRHWRLVFRQAFRGARPGEPRGTYLSYPAAFWIAVVGMAVMFGWLVAAGAGTLAALNIVLVLHVAFILVTRLVAETGLLHTAMPVSVTKPLELLAIHADTRVSPESFYLTATMQATYYDYREPAPVYLSNGLRSIDAVRSDEGRADAERAFGRRLILLVFAALAIAYTASFWSSVATRYSYSVGLNVSPYSPIDPWGGQDNARAQILDTSVAYQGQTYVASYHRGAHLTGGFVVAAALSVMRFYFAWWPLHPIGYLMYGTFPINLFWFSLFLGWLAKRLVLRLGSASYYERCKPFFIGLIFGELAGACLWMTISHALHAMGLPYRSYLVLPQ